jgi:uncharacterized protein (DUF1697 family)
MSKKNIFLALLRGINVGGNNLIKMADLKGYFEEMGFSDVVTYIQSGNVLFKDFKYTEEVLTKRTEEFLEKKLKYSVPVVVVAYTHLKTVVENAPSKFGDDKDKYRYDVLFLKPPLQAAEAVKSVLVKEGVDEVHSGKGVLYFSRLTAKATQSKLSRIVGSPIYKNITIRNWNTTTKLLALMEK